MCLDHLSFDHEEHPAQPRWLREPAGFQRLTLGDTRITHIPDGFAQLNPEKFLPDPSGDGWKDLSDYLDADEFLMASMGSLLVERGDRRLLIDTGMGPMRVGAGESPTPMLGKVHTGQLAANLRQIGVSPGDIDIVAVTHIHADHVGGVFAGDASGEIGPLFTNARHRLAGDEWAHWTQPSVSPDVSREKFFEPMSELMKSRGTADTFIDGFEIFPDVTAWTTPGHTPGHTSFVISGGGYRLIVVGDAMHSPAQLSGDAWCCASDVDSPEAQRTRDQLIDELGREKTIGYAGHFGAAVFGVVRRTEGGAPTWHKLAGAT
jgi:glyoxylase-like metal-dependent hydrolase (beta-lactamase superfamily II)